MSKENKERNYLPLIAAIVVIAAAVVTLMPKDTFSGNDPALESQPSESTSAVRASDIVIPSGDIGTQASFYDADVDGITVQVLAVQASDGTIRLALNTCQVCNGSPYAYFAQEGDWFICQNCKNRFASTEIGIASGGCRPVPITADIYTEENGVITIPGSFLAEKAPLFKNWKKF